MTCVTTAWTAHTAMASATYSYHRRPVYGTYIYCFRGANISRYDTATDTWNTSLTAAPVSVSGMGDVQVEQGGKIYCFGGGFGSAYGGATAYDRVMIYDIDGDSWSQGASMPSGRLDAAAVSDGTYIYVIGGLTSGGSQTATIQRYNPAANTWTTTLTDMDVNRNQHELIYDNGLIYALMGQSGAGTTDSTSIYNIAGDSWSAGATSPTDASGFSAAKAGGWIYVGGGIKAGTPQTAVWRMRLSTGSWENPSLAVQLPESRWLPTWAEIGDTIWSIGGDHAGSLDGKTICLDVSTGLGLVVGYMTLI